MLKTVEVEVHCTSDTSGFPPSYRLYINDTLFTERTFIWNSNIMIKEQMLADLPPGTYYVRAEPCKDPGTFVLKNLTVDGVPAVGLQFELK